MFIYEPSISDIASEGKGRGPQKGEYKKQDTGCRTCAIITRLDYKPLLNTLKIKLKFIDAPLLHRRMCLLDSLELECYYYALNFL